MARAPAPSTLPGEFFVLTYDRGDATYTLFVDDDSHSSYNLGNDIERVMRYFRVTGFDDLGFRAMDIAREFGAAQVVPGEGRVFKIDPQPQRGSADRDVFAERRDERAYVLPPL